MCRLRLLCSVVAFALELLALNAGVLDPSFQLDPRVQGRIDAVRPTPDHSIYIGGLFTNLAGGGDAWLLRLTPQGTLDESFRPWKPSWSSKESTHTVRSIELEPGGHVWMSAGWNVFYPPFFPNPGSLTGGLFVRISPDGTTSGDGNSLNADVHLTLQNNRAILWGVRRWIYSIGAVSEAVLERRWSNGALDTSFVMPPGFRTGNAGSFDDGLQSVTVTANGDPLLTGELRFQPFQFASLIRLNTDGGVRWSYSDVVSSGSTAAETTDGRILLAGFDYRTQATRVVRLRADGTEDLSYLGPSGSWGVTQYLIEPNGRLVMAGSFTNVLGVRRNGLAALLPDGSLDLGFDPGVGFTGNPKVRSLVRQADGRILVLGDFAEFDGLPQRSLFRTEPADAEAAATAPNQYYIVAREPAWECGQPGRYAVVRAGRLDHSTSIRVRTVSQTAVAGIDFAPLETTVSFAPGERSRVVEVVGLPDELNEGQEQFGLELEVDPSEGAMGGRSVTMQTIGDQPCSLALASDQMMTDERTAEILIPAPYPPYGDLTPFRFRLRTIEGSALAGRDFQAIDWTGEWGQWPPIRIFDNADANKDREFVVELTAVGGGVSIGVPSRMTVTIRDDDTLAGPSRGIRGSVRQLLDADSTGWFVIGEFDSVDGVQVPGVARLLDDGTLDRSFTPPPDLDGPVSTAVSVGNGSLIIGGAFTRCWGKPAPGLARLLPDGRLDPNPPIQLSSVPAACSLSVPQVVQFLARRPDGQLWVAGSLPQIQGCGYPTQLAVFDASGRWVQGWDYREWVQFSLLFAIGGNPPQYYLLTQDDTLVDSYGIRANLPKSYQDFALINSYQPMRPVVAGSIFSLIDSRHRIVRVLQLGSSFQIRGVFDEVSVAERKLPIAQLISWCPLASGEVMISGYFSPEGSLTGRFTINNIGVQAVSPLHSIAVEQLTEARDGRIAGLVGSGRVHLVRLSRDGAPLSDLRIDNVSADADGAVHLALKGQSPGQQTIEVSPDLKNWTPLSWSQTVTGPNVCIDRGAQDGTGSRFYRVRY